MMSEKTRVLIVSQGHPALVPGGADIAAHDLFRDLNQSGEAEACFLGCVTAWQRPAPADCALQPLEGTQNEFLLHVGEFDPFMLAHGIDSRSLDDFGRLLDSFSPDIVHFHHLSLIGAESLALVRNRLPCARIVFTLNDFHPICHRGGLMARTWSDALCDEATPEACHGCFSDIAPERFALRVNHLRNMLRMVDRFVASSMFLRGRFADWGIPAHMIEWIPNGLPDVIRSEAREARPGHNRFGFFGSIAPHKGPLLALEAVRRIDPAVELTLTLHGAVEVRNGTFCEAFDRALDRAGDRARYAGPYARRDIGRLMEEVDWVVVPSIWWEAAPLVILEGFRLGRPVITGDVGGMAEMVDHGVNGLLFRCNDAADLAQTMQKAAGEEGLWDRMTAALRAVPMMSDVTARHISLYRDLRGHTQRKSA